jgi:hypothetical protein
MLTFSSEQCRVIGVLLEKESTTPDQYPLSLNALTNGCNQKSNRDPVYSLSEDEVQQVVDQLIELNCINCQSEKNGRVSKYQHRFCNTPFGDLQLDDKQRAVLCVLLLRGAQTAGELKTRCHRLAEFTQLSEVELTLQQLQELNGEHLIEKLPRELGKRESRYRQLFSKDKFIDANNSAHLRKLDHTSIESSEKCNATLQSRVEQLEQQIERLNERLEKFNQLLSDPPLD